MSKSHISFGLSDAVVHINKILMGFKNAMVTITIDSPESLSKKSVGLLFYGVHIWDVKQVFVAVRRCSNMISDGHLHINLHDLMTSLIVCTPPGEGNAIQRYITAMERVQTSNDDETRGSRIGVAKRSICKTNNLIMKHSMEWQPSDDHMLPMARVQYGRNFVSPRHPLHNFIEAGDLVGTHTTSVYQILGMVAG